MLAPQRFTLHEPPDGISTAGLSRLRRQLPQTATLGAVSQHKQHEQSYGVVAAIVVPVVAALALRAAWRPRRGSLLQATPRVACRVEGSTQTETNVETKARTKPKKKTEDDPEPCS
mmetsp:Transcript_3265/g.6170  ORF Transcript_3265/g.6170 Transcript_3265/m.6170 type:complete len:116 (+) Transcript_3265:23-370(+)